MANYKCPKCGAPIVFKPELGGFKCDYCFSTFTEAELTAAMEKTKTTAQPETRKDTDGDGVLGYTCKNCGAEVVVGDTANTAYCYYCHSPIVIASRLENEFKPDFIIPFKIDKKQALAKFLAWAKKKKYVPRDFTGTMQQEKMTGIYLPYWQADFTAHIDYSAVGVETRVWQSGDTEYTETKKYDIKRSGESTIKNINELAFSKINTNLINAISNFDEEEQLPFSPGYLAGFFSEQYDRPKEACEKNLTARAKETVQDQIASSYDVSRVEDEQDNTTLKTDRLSYTLFPSWILSYVYKGKSYIFSVNGQTGAIAGEAPLSTGKVILGSVIKAAIVAGLLILGGLLIW